MAQQNEEASISIIVPAYKEAQNIAPLVEEISEALSPSGQAWEIIIVDDDSRDGIDQVCAAVKTQIAQKNGSLRLISRSGQRDLSLAVLDGFRYATKDILVVMDADLSHPPAAIPALVQAVIGGADIALGSRYLSGPGRGRIEAPWGIYRKLNSLLATWLAKPLVKVTDPMAGFFAARRELFDTVRLSPIGYKILLEILVKCPIERIIEVPIHFRERRAGKSKLNLKQQYLYLKHLRRLYCHRWPLLLEIMHFCTVGCSGLCIDIAIFMLAVYGLGIHHLLAKIISFLTAASSNWALNRRFSFPAAHRARRDKQWMNFILVSGSGALLNLLIYWYLISSFAQMATAPFIAVAAAAVATAAWNFTFAKLFIFRRDGK